MKFLIKTLGCKVNQVESAFIIEELKKEGFVLAEEEGTSEIFILNSCAVTERAYKEALKILRHWGTLKPKAIIITGCSAQIYADKLKEIAKGLEVENFLILGQEQKFELKTYLKELSTKEEPIIVETSSK
ncbi:MAG: hypothetical protein ACK4Y7_05910, partial [Caldimicrobium sp.]